MNGPMNECTNKCMYTRADEREEREIQITRDGDLT